MKKFLTFSFLFIGVLFLFACGEVTNVRVIFETNGGSAIATVEVDVKKASLFEIPQTPTKEDHIFCGWFLDSKFNTRFTSLPVDKSVLTLYAKWEKVPEDGSLEYNFDASLVISGKDDALSAFKKMLDVEYVINFLVEDISVDDINDIKAKSTIYMKAIDSQGPGAPETMEQSVTAYVTEGYVYIDAKMVMEGVSQEEKIKFAIQDLIDEAGIDFDFEDYKDFDDLDLDEILNEYLKQAGLGDYYDSTFDFEKYFKLILPNIKYQNNGVVYTYDEDKKLETIEVVKDFLEAYTNAIEFVQFDEYKDELYSMIDEFKEQIVINKFELQIGYFDQYLQKDDKFTIDVVIPDFETSTQIGIIGYCDNTIMFGNKTIDFSKINPNDYSNIANRD